MPRASSPACSGGVSPFEGTRGETRRELAGKDACGTSRAARPPGEPPPFSPSLFLPVLLLVLLTACSPAKTPEPPKPAAPAPAATNTPPAAQALFDRITKEFHLPSAEASGARRKELLGQAAAGYEQLLREHPTHTNLCAQALRSLANIRATEGRLDDAIALHASVAQRYPAEEWEILQSWKSAGDLLTDAQRAADAAPFYRQIVERFDRTNAAPVVQIIVRSARKRLAAPRRRGVRPSRAQRGGACGGVGICRRPSCVRALLRPGTAALRARPRRSAPQELT
ncbi:hypothetical protein LBMAG56_41830 [Verrucomicrobiota bacterium]|nr:hypothetical protein LBMAG56_41830 [Verrucomicrobiota bacterium]